MTEARVMIVDGEPIVCDRLKEHLANGGFEVDAFTDSDSALEALGQKSYDVIVTDLAMGGPTGIDVLRNIRERGYRTQVIVIAGVAPPEAAQEAKAVGAFDFLTRPFELKELTRKVESAAEHAWRGRRESGSESL